MQQNKKLNKDYNMVIENVKQKAPIRKKVIKKVLNNHMSPNAENINNRCSNYCIDNNKEEEEEIKVEKKNNNKKEI